MILITGASGFVGTHLVHSLSKTHKIRCLLRDSSKSTFPDCEIVYGDLLNHESLLHATKGIDTVVHLAAAISSTDTSSFFHVNVDGMESLVSASKENKVNKFIFISSGAVTTNEDLYSVSKEKAEKILSCDRQKYTEREIPKDSLSSLILFAHFQQYQFLVKVIILCNQSILRM